MSPITREAFAVLVKDIKPRLKRELRFVPEEITEWGSRDFLAVMNRGRSEGVLLFGNRVVPFRLQARKPNASGRIEAIICDFCATWQRGTNSAIISFPDERSTRSFLCCGDLNCSLHVRNKTLESKLSRVQLKESNTVERRIERLRAKLEETL